MRILDGLRKDRFVRALERSGANDLAEVDPAVRRIVNDIRRAGDPALRRYAMRWDRLERSEPVLVPEHLTLPATPAPGVKNAGSIFLNEFTPQSAGDYISGPNHVLPTGAMALVRGGLSVMDCVRIISCQEVSREGIRQIAPPAIALAKAEGLCGHAESLRVRCSHA
jgi:histidinol dehydrogenase